MSSCILVYTHFIWSESNFISNFLNVRVLTQDLCDKKHVIWSWKAIHLSKIVWGFWIPQNCAKKYDLGDSWLFLMVGNNFNSILKAVTLYWWPFNGVSSLYIYIFHIDFFTAKNTYTYKEILEINLGFVVSWRQFARNLIANSLLRWGKYCL